MLAVVGSGSTECDVGSAGKSFRFFYHVKQRREAHFGPCSDECEVTAVNDMSSLDHSMPKKIEVWAYLPCKFMS